MKRILMISLMVAMTFSSSFGQANEPLSFPVFLNHFFLVIDTETYAAIENHPFLRKEFSPNETRTTRRTDISYTGLYFYGVNTYFEFFDVAKETRRKVGDSGLAFGVEQEGAVKVLQARLQTPPPVLITRPLQDKQVGWFYSLTPRNFSFTSGTSSWIMEYHPSFLSVWNPQTGDANQGITRRQALQRYAAVLPERLAQPYFQEVQSITLAADPATIASLSDMCRAFGYHSRPSGEAQVYEGPGFTLRLVAESESARGIQAITLRVHRVPRQKEYRFGKKSVLQFHADKTATWSF